MATADIVAQSEISSASHRRAVRIWLWSVAMLIFAMVVLGGATRLTQSGLSITEWKPVAGALPPWSQEAWQAAFEKYKVIPQYDVFNKGMSLGEFKVIYWWEWSHRQLGRLIGLAFALPLAAFWLLGWLDDRMKPRLVALLALGGSQGALGWWMVASGLSDRTDVSQYRLAMHMTLACIIFAAIVFVAQGLAQKPERAALSRSRRLLAYALVPLVLMQIFLGGLVAGLDAGLSHNTWPLMDGHFIPPASDLYVMNPAWVNHFENAMTVQFQHRMVAYLILALVLWQAWDLRKIGVGAAAGRAMALAALVLVQAAIGITTLLLMVPLWAALLHQATAVVLLAMASVHARAVADGATPAGMREVVTRA